MADIIDLEIKIEKAGEGIILLGLIGNLDGGTFGQLDRTIEDFCDKGIYKFIIDLTGLEYVSSAGAGVLIGWVGTLRDKKGDLVLVNPQPGVKAVFDMIGLTNCMSIADERLHALKIISQPPAQY